MLLLSKDKKTIVNLDNVLTIDAIDTEVAAYQDRTPYRMTLGEYDSAQRCKNIIVEIYDAYSKGIRSYTMPQK